MEGTDLPNNLDKCLFAPVLALNSIVPQVYIDTVLPLAFPLQLYQDSTFIIAFACFDVKTVVIYPAMHRWPHVHTLSVPCVITNTEPQSSEAHTAGASPASAVPSDPAGESGHCPSAPCGSSGGRGVFPQEVKWLVFLLGGF